MRVLPEQFKQAAAKWWEKHIRAEDPDDRRAMPEIATIELRTRKPCTLPLPPAR